MEALCLVASMLRERVAGMLAAMRMLMARLALWVRLSSPLARLEISVRKDWTSGSSVFSGLRVSSPVSRLWMMRPPRPTLALRTSPTMPWGRRSLSRGKRLLSTKVWVLASPNWGSTSPARSAPTSFSHCSEGSWAAGAASTPLSSLMRPMRRCSNWA